MGRHVFVVELLLLHGASVRILNKRQRTAMDCAEHVSAASKALQGSLGVRPDLRWKQSVLRVSRTPR